MTGQKSLHVYSSLHLLPDRTAAHLLRVAAASTVKCKNVRGKKKKKKEVEGIFLKSLFQEDKLIEYPTRYLIPDKHSGTSHYCLLFAVGYFTPVNPLISKWVFSLYSRLTTII